MSSIDTAISVMQQEVDSFSQGTKAQPADGTPEWFILRAKALGLSSLKRIKQIGLEGSPREAEKIYQSHSAEVKRAAV